MDLCLLGDYGNIYYIDVNEIILNLSQPNLIGGPAHQLQSLLFAARLNYFEYVTQFSLFVLFKNIYVQYVFKKFIHLSLIFFKLITLLPSTVTSCRPFCN